MITYSGVINDNEYFGYANNSVSYAVNCSGYVKISTKDVHMTRIRADYYLVYLINGKCLYRLDNSSTEASAGDVIFYRPGERDRKSTRLNSSHT